VSTPFGQLLLLVLDDRIQETQHFILEASAKFLSDQHFQLSHFLLSFDVLNAFQMPAQLRRLCQVHPGKWTWAQIFYFDFCHDCVTPSPYQQILTNQASLT